MQMRADSSSLLALLQHPLLWRGRGSARLETLSSGFRRLDEGLPGEGWPCAGLIEILTPRFGLGELQLLMPLLARSSRSASPRWVTWVAPPFEPYAPGLAGHGVTVSHQLVVRTETPLWAMEQSLRSGACAIALAWPRRAQARSVRRLQLAAEQGRSLGVLFRALTQARETSPAMLRLRYEPTPSGCRVQLLKSRGGTRTPIEIAWADAGVKRGAA
jgi:hypothetical protein